MRTRRATCLRDRRHAGVPEGRASRTRTSAIVTGTSRHRFRTSRFPRGRDSLMVKGRAGRAGLRLAIEHLAQHRTTTSAHGRPRFRALVIKLDEDPARSSRSRPTASRDRPGATTLAPRTASIKCLFPTPKLFEALCEKVSAEEDGDYRRCSGGTEMTPQFHLSRRRGTTRRRLLAPTSREHADGLTTHKFTEPEDDYALSFTRVAARDD